MREPGHEIQLHSTRRGCGLAFAGLPASIDGVVVDETLTFLQRAKCVELTRLSDYEVGDSFEETMAKGNCTIGDEAAQLLVSAAAGYPFMVQLVGYYAWQASSRRDSSEVTLEDAKRGVEIARKSFDNMVIAPALRRVSRRQLEYLVAMARCGEGPVATGAVAKRLGVEPSGVSSLPQASNRCGYRGVPGIRTCKLRHSLYARISSRPYGRAGQIRKSPVNLLIRAAASRAPC